MFLKCLADSSTSNLSTSSVEYSVLKCVLFIDVTYGGHLLLGLIWFSSLYEMAALYLIQKKQVFTLFCFVLCAIMIADAASEFVIFNILLSSCFSSIQKVTTAMFSCLFIYLFIFCTVE